MFVFSDANLWNISLQIASDPSVWDSHAVFVCEDVILECMKYSSAESCWSSESKNESNPHQTKGKSCAMPDNRDESITQRPDNSLGSKERTLNSQSCETRSECSGRAGTPKITASNSLDSQSGISSTNSQMCQDEKLSKAVTQVLEANSDLEAGVYEGEPFPNLYFTGSAFECLLDPVTGGLKVWECALDLTEYLVTQDVPLEGLDILEVMIMESVDCQRCHIFEMNANSLPHSLAAELVCREFSVCSTGPKESAFKIL